MKENLKITIFTPTYNRKILLRRVFETLKNQTNKNFIWLIVDDGSTDKTLETVLDFKKDSDFKIDYLFQENGGKHKAHNTGVLNCQTEYFLILDSDDYLTNDAVEVLYQKINLISKNPKISGVIGNRVDNINFLPIGKEIPNILYASGNELYQKYNFKGDTLRMYKTLLLKKYLFPEIKGEKFISENVVFDKIDEKYKMLVIKEKLYIGEYQEEGYSNNIYEIHKKNPKGYLLSLNSAARYAITMKKKATFTILYLIWKKVMKISKDDIPNIESLGKIEYIMYPIAVLFIKIKFPKFFFKHFK